ncbi:phospholipase D-like domain-containing protein [Nocardioides speluncae]|uniref:phospholipase D-like domain-containing protein n=1 Tax=Nocardioides speluncae TaxID=2670337 RepID=UPI000D689CE8|nr:phospholipase D-like domain-containing protein [Nocardioides speluncae]
MSFPVRTFVVALIATVLPITLAVLIDDANAAPRQPEARRAAVAIPAQPVPSYPKPFRPIWGPVFNNPMGDLGAQRRILEYIIKVVDGAPPGGTIRISMYVFNDRSVWHALNRALDRGVRLRIVLDGGHDIPAPAERLRAQVGDDPRAVSYLVECEKSCRGELGVNHQKFFMLTSSAGVRHVVLVSSGNMTGGNVDQEWNDLFSIAGSKPVYDAFAGVFEQLKLDQPVARPYVEAEQRTFLQGFYPARGIADGGRDPWLDYLDNVSCTGAARPGLKGRTKIRVTMSAMHGDRGRIGARRLVELQKAGCDVKVIFGASSGKGVRSILTGGGVIWRLSSEKGLRAHQKLLLISGKIGDDPLATRVYTGSLNWTDSAVNRDEVVLGVKGERTMKLYAQNWYYMWRFG